jgi:23S rRNA (pseudouridine1915-N3)-methyltransferase
MKIRILAVGKLKRGPLSELMDEYKKRCRWPIQIIEIDHSSKAGESSQLIGQLTNEDHVIIMDERGDSLSSQEFANQIDKLQVTGKSRLNFIIGGAYGFDQEIMAKAHKKIAFGVQTWPHMFVRLMLIEQIYRAEQILSGHPYHKE